MLIFPHGIDWADTQKHLSPIPNPPTTVLSARSVNCFTVMLSRCSKHSKSSLICLVLPCSILTTRLFTLSLFGQEPSLDAFPFDLETRGKSWLGKFVFGH